MHASLKLVGAQCQLVLPICAFVENLQSLPLVPNIFLSVGCTDGPPSARKLTQHCRLSVGHEVSTYPPPPQGGTEVSHSPLNGGGRDGSIRFELCKLCAKAC